MANGVKITNAGLAITSNLMSGLGGTIPKWIGQGTGTTTPAAADTTLQIASAEARAVGTPTRITTTATNDTLSISGTIASASTQAVTELGTFDALTTGNLHGHAVFSAINVTNVDSILFTCNTVFTST